MKGATNWGLIILIAVALYVANVFAFLGPQFESPFFAVGGTGGTGGGSGSGSGGSIGYATTITNGVIDAISGAAGDGNIECFDTASGWTAGPDDIGNVLAGNTYSSAAPNSFSGYCMVWNDANQGTDQGTEYYARRIPFSYNNQGAVTVPDTDGDLKINQWAEASSLTNTGYDDGTVEATLNVTVGTSVVSSTELKVETAADSCFGNPDFDGQNPIGVCFNVSTQATFNEVRPTNYRGTFDVPEVLKAYNVIGCYILPTDSLCDDGMHDTFYRYYVTIDPAANPGVTDYAYAFYFEKTWFYNDAGEWVSGYSDDSISGTDYDPGLAALGNEKAINFT